MMGPKSISMYIKQSPVHTRATLRQLYKCIKKHAPDAKEEITGGMPTFLYKETLVAFAGFKYHIGFYPTHSAIEAFPKELSKFHIEKDSIQFPLDKPLPLPLIKKIVKFRIKELKEEDKKLKG